MAALALFGACADGASSYKLDLAVDGAGTIDPAPGTRLYAPGANVSVTATAASGATFTGWSGNATGTSNPLSVAMDSDKALTAHFSGGSATTTYTLTLASSGAGSTTPAAGAHSYSSGATVSVTATATSGATFTGWSGDATGTSNPVSVVMSSDKALTAHFSEGDDTTYTLTLTSTGNGSTAPAAGAHSYSPGATVSVTATPTSGATFTGWSGDAAGTDNPISVAMTSNKSLTAQFSTSTPVKSGLPAPSGGGVPTPSGTPGNLTVIDWAGFKAAVSFSFDDSQPSQIEHYAELQAVGVPMTFYANNDSSGPAFDPAWTQAVRDGHEMGCHTANHCSADFHDCSNHLATPLDEIDANTDYIEQHFGQSSVWTMASPYGDAGWEQYAEQRFFVNRGVGYGMVAPKDNTDPFGLPVYMLGSNDTSSKLNGQVDTAHSGGKWLIFLIHSILPTQANWYAGTDVAVITGAMSHAKTSGDIWVGRVVDVAAYWRAQKLLSSLSPTVSGSTRTWTWTLPAHFPPGKFVRVKVDGGTLKQGDSILAWDEHGYYEVALDAGSLTLSP